jgi:hypothetical protein
MTKSARFVEVRISRDSESIPVTQSYRDCNSRGRGAREFLSPLFPARQFGLSLAVEQFADEPLRGDFEDQVMWTVVHGGEASHEERKILMELSHPIGLD